MVSADLPDPAETERDLPATMLEPTSFDDSEDERDLRFEAGYANGSARARYEFTIAEDLDPILIGRLRGIVGERNRLRAEMENRNDPIETGLEAALGEAEEENARLTARLAELEAENVELRENLERSREWRDTWHAKWREVSAENADLARQLADQRVRADHWCERAEQLRLAAAPDQAVREDRPAVGDCGNASPGNWLAMSTCVNPSHCTLPFGHQGWHRDARTGARWGKEWSDPADEVREEWARVEGNYDSSDIEHDDIHLDGELVRMHARKWGGTVYRRTVTTTPWVAVPPTPEPEDGAGT